MGGVGPGLREWAEVADLLIKEPGVCLLLGAADTGKSTLAAFLATACFKAGRRTCVIDADVGQSDIGLPTTIGMGMVRGEIERLREVSVDAWYFVGRNSPESAMLPMIAGCLAMARKARAMNAEVVIVNTTGAVSGSVGRTLKAAKVEVLRPRYVLALQRGSEIEHLLAPVERSGRGIRVIRLPVSARARARSRDERRVFRERRFASYFAGAGLQVLKWTRISTGHSILGTGRPLGDEELRDLSAALSMEVVYGERCGDMTYVVVADELTPARRSRVFTTLEAGPIFAAESSSFDRLLVGLEDEEGDLLGVGIIISMKWREACAEILTPVKDPGSVARLVFGELRVAPDGVELGRLPPGSL